MQSAASGWLFTPSPGCKGLQSVATCGSHRVGGESIVVHVDAPNYRPPSTNLPKKERDERRHAKAIHAWQSGAHQLVEEQPE